MANIYTAEIETKTKTGLSQKISISFMLVTAMLVVGTVIFAAAYTYIINTWGTSSNQAQEKTTNTNAPGNINTPVNADDHSFDTE